MRHFGDGEPADPNRSVQQIQCTELAVFLVGARDQHRSFWKRPPWFWIFWNMAEEQFLFLSGWQPFIQCSERHLVDAMGKPSYCHLSTILPDNLSVIKNPLTRVLEVKWVLVWHYLFRIYSDILSHSLYGMLSDMYSDILPGNLI